MKLLFIFTGGTIGSTAGDTVAPDSGAPRLLLEKYGERYGIDFSYDTLSPMSELSENFTGEHISLLLDAVVRHIDGYDGVIVTHGTDTLAYSAAALGYALGNASLPVCLVSANFPIADGRSNALANLRAAVLLIRTGTERGVFVPYDNGDGATVIHRATRLSTSLALSDKVFSVNEAVCGRVTEDAFQRSPDFRELPDATAAPPVRLCAQSTDILRVFPYPGMVYPEIPDGTRFILLDTYHSGTFDGKSAAVRAFLASARARGIPVLVTDGTAYDSTRIYDEYGVTRLPLSPIAAYMKLWLYGDTRVMLASRGGDLFK